VNKFVVIGTPGERRVELFQAALAALKLPPAHLITYPDMLTGRVALPDVLQPGDVLRIESPGRDVAVARALLAAGAAATEQEGTFAWIPAQHAEQMAYERGRILYPRQWYLGLCAVLQRIEEQRAACPPHRLMNMPPDIAAMFDKCHCHSRLRRNTIAVPRSLNPEAAGATGCISGYDELIERMQAARCWRVFVKLAHGSSASGVVAYQVQRQQHLATTTVEMVRPAGAAGQPGAIRLYNSRRIRTYREVGDIAALIDTLCRHRVHVEQWLPKAGLDGRAFDLRVVVIAGQPCHSVVRLSHSPMTNLHLLNARADTAAVVERMGTAAWEAVGATCKQVAACFPHSLYAGIDVLIMRGYRRHAVLEVNAFGDLLPGLLYNGQDTYTHEISACLQQPISSIIEHKHLKHQGIGR
jgi:hypothetical protein